MSRIAELLIVEDNLADQVLFRECADACSKRINVTFVGDGVQAMEFLRAEGKFAGRTLPNVVLLDLSLPKKDGKEVLREMRSDDTLREIPVIVMSTSNNPQDIEAVKKLGATRYVTKPNDLARYVSLVEEVVTTCYESPTLAR